MGFLAGDGLHEVEDLGAMNAVEFGAKLERANGIEEGIACDLAL